MGRIGPIGLIENLLTGIALNYLTICFPDQSNNPVFYADVLQQE